MSENDEYQTIQEGVAEGELIGGNTFLTKGIVAGKYSVNFENKIYQCERRIRREKRVYRYLFII